MCEVSILMSVYNEKEAELIESIESILNQSHANFEYLIVNDNPNRIELKEILEDYQKKDKRIKIINNKENIGLAMSLNKAAEMAKTKTFVRMDADDISATDRIERQLVEINKGYDFVFTPYTFINEESQPIHTVNDEHLNYYSSYDIHRMLPIKNIIHHPTVMMTRRIFENAGGYRDFPCAQDYDLWLRIYDAGAKFKMVDQSLLKYRIRMNSISRTKKYQQKLTLDYTKKLFVERIRKGTDSFSKDSYNDFLRKHGAYNSKKAEKMRYYNEILSKAKRAKTNNDYIKYYFYRLRVFIRSKDYRETYINKIKYKILLKNYINDNLKSLS